MLLQSYLPKCSGGHPVSYRAMKLVYPSDKTAETVITNISTWIKALWESAIEEGPASLNLCNISMNGVSCPQSKFSGDIKSKLPWRD